jgi:replicative DNA helicase
MGKSTLAFNIAHNVSKHQKKRVALFSMEMTAFELILKFMSMETGISTRLLQCHEKITTALNEDAGLMGRLLKGAEALSKLEIFIDDASQITISNIRGKLNNLVKEGYKPDLIIFDYLQLIKIYTKTDNRNNQIAELSQELKAIAKDFDVPVIVISQLNRGTETGERKEQTPDFV